MRRPLPALATGAMLALLPALLAVAPIANNDIWLHLKTGERILSEGAVPRVDDYTFTRAGAPYVAHEWLAQVLLAGLHRPGGMALLSILYALAVGGVLLLIHRNTARTLARCGEATEEAARAVPGIVTLAAFVLMMPFLSIRPHLATFLLAALFGALLPRLDSADPAGRRRVVLSLLALQVLWANLHGGFVAGILLGGIHAAAWCLRRRAVVPLAALPAGLAAVSCLNPYGWRIYGLVARFADPAFRRIIVEWRTPFDSGFAATPVFWVGMIWVALAIAGAVRALRREGDHAPWLMLIALGAMAADSRRHISLLAIVTAPSAGRGLATLVSRMSRRATAQGAPAPWPPAARAAWEWSGAAAAAMLCAWLGYARLSDPGMPLRPGLIARNIPVEALEVMRAEGLRGRVFTTLGLGSYITWRGWPELTTSIDSRLEVFGGAFIEEHLAAARDPRRFAAFAAAHPFDAALLPWRLASVRGALAAMKVDPAWAMIYVDDTVMLHVRRTPQNAALVARREYRLFDPVRFLSGGGAGPVPDPAEADEARRAASDPPILPDRPPVNTIARRMAGLM